MLEPRTSKVAAIVCRYGMSMSSNEVIGKGSVGYDV